MAIGTWLKLQAAQALIVRVVLFAVFLGPISMVACMCGLSVLTMAANRSPKVSEWPFSRLGDAWGECMIVLVSLVLGTIPGAMLGGLLNALQTHSIIGTSAMMLSIWALSPIILLSMIQNSSIMQPYSKRIKDSMFEFQDAWGAMYLQSGIAYTVIVGLLLMSSTRGPIGCGVLGFFIPFFAFVIFNQIGVLAGRISGAMNLGFDGDFSDDQ